MNALPLIKFFAVDFTVFFIKQWTDWFAAGSAVNTTIIEQPSYVRLLIENIFIQSLAHG